MVQARVANPAARFALHKCRYLEATLGPGMHCKPSSTFHPAHVEVFRSYSWYRHALQTQQHILPYTRAGIQKLLVVQAHVANPEAHFALHTCWYLEATRGPGTGCKPSSTFHPTHLLVFRSYSWSRHRLQTQQHVSPNTLAGI